MTTGFCKEPSAYWPGPDNFLEANFEGGSKDEFVTHYHGHWHVQTLTEEVAHTGSKSMKITPGGYPCFYLGKSPSTYASNKGDKLRLSCWARKVGGGQSRMRLEFHGRSGSTFSPNSKRVDLTEEWKLYSFEGVNAHSWDGKKHMVNVCADTGTIYVDDCAVCKLTDLNDECKPVSA